MIAGSVVCAQVPQAVRVQIDLRDYLDAAYSYNSAVVGFVDQNTLITARYGLNGKSTVDFWDISSKRISRQIDPPAPINAKSIAVSADHKLLVATEDIATDRTPPECYPHHVYLWDLATLHLVRSIDTGDKNEVVSANFSPQNSNKLIVTETAPGSANDGRVVIVNADTGRTILSSAYPDAGYLESCNLIFSPVSDFGIGLFAPSPNHFGSFDVLDATSFRLLSSYSGTPNSPVDSPLFFVSKSKVVVGSVIYDMETRSISPLMPNHPGRRCMASIPGHLGFAIFESEEHLELWNVLKEKMLFQWLLPRHNTVLRGSKSGPESGTEPVWATAVYVSLDDKAFGYLDSVGTVRVYSCDFNALTSSLG